MKRIALVGPPYSGKTSIAHQLTTRYGFHLINFTDILKKHALNSLRAAELDVTYHDLLEDKGKYRAFLQELAVLIGFNCDPKFVHEAAHFWWWNRPRCSAVVDNVRTNEQALVWAGQYGFKIVRLIIDPNIQAMRAADHGVSYEQLQRQSQHFIEQGIDDEHVSLTLDVSSCGIDELCRTLYNFGE